MLVICSVPVPVLRKVTGSALLGWPTTSCPNIRLLADRLRLGAAPGILLEQAAVMQIPIRMGPTNFFILVPPSNQTTRNRGLVEILQRESEDFWVDSVSGREFVSRKRRRSREKVTQKF